MNFSFSSLVIFENLIAINSKSSIAERHIERLKSNLYLSSSQLYKTSSKILIGIKFGVFPSIEIDLEIYLSFNTELHKSSLPEHFKHDSYIK